VLIATAHVFAEGQGGQAMSIAEWTQSQSQDGQAMFRSLADADDNTTAKGDSKADTAPVVVAEDDTLEGYFPTFYHVYLIPMILLTLVLGFLARPSTQEVIPEGFRRFQYSYLVVWCVCVAADWLQGPYLYAIYSAYGCSNSEIAILFVTGFGSSLVFGCMAGVAADRFGRKKTCLAYCITYIMSCFAIHFNYFPALMVGRITGGIATDLLFSCFECWMVSEHLSRHKFSGGLLGYMFGLMFSLMYLVAIVAGLVGQVLVDSTTFHAVGGSNFYVGGLTGPFDLAILALIIGLILISVLWEENYGETNGSGSMTENLSIAWKLLTTDVNMVLMAVVVSCFEGSMFAFVFNWTPALTSESVPPPHGYIFAMFMMACMCGASVATIVGDSIKLSTRLMITFVTGILSFCTMSAVAGDEQFLAICFTAFLFFEFCVGLYFPSIGGLKSQVVPENVRATVYTIYRIPLNAIVVGLLLSNISLIHCFILCGVLLTFALIAMLSIRIPKVEQGTLSLVENEARALESASQSEMASKQ